MNTGVLVNANRSHGLALEAFGFVGTSHDQVGFDRLGRFVLPPGDVGAREALREALGADELLYLATCNRVECYVALPEPASDLELRARFAAHFASLGSAVEVGELTAHAGFEALRHAYTVASSLRSLVVGETEIAGQMRRAWQEAEDGGLVGKRLRFLNDGAQACARRVRAETDIGALATSVGTLAVRKILQHFGSAGPGVSVLIGVGPMTVKAARGLQEFAGERIFVNRTLEKAEALAERFGGQALSLEAFLASPPPRIDLLFTATAAQRSLISRDLLARVLAARKAAGAGPLIVCDLGVPRDVDAEVDGLPGLLLVTMQEIQALTQARRAQLSGELARAEGVVAEAIARVEREARFASLAQRSTQALLARQLSHVSEEDQAVILRFTEQLAARMARQPNTLL